MSWIGNLNRFWLYILLGVISHCRNGTNVSPSCNGKMWLYDAKPHWNYHAIDLEPIFQFDLVSNAIMASNANSHKWYQLLSFEYFAWIAYLWYTVCTVHSAHSNWHKIQPHFISFGFGFANSKKSNCDKNQAIRQTSCWWCMRCE